MQKQQFLQSSKSLQRLWGHLPYYSRKQYFSPFFLPVCASLYPPDELSACFNLIPTCFHVFSFPPRRFSSCISLFPSVSWQRESFCCCCSKTRLRLTKFMLSCWCNVRVHIQVSNCLRYSSRCQWCVNSYRHVWKRWVDLWPFLPRFLSEHTHTHTHLGADIWVCSHSAVYICLSC